MSQLQPILLVLLLGAVGYAVYLWRKISGLEGSLRADRQASDERRADLEKARKESRERRDELEDLRKQLQDAKGKLKRQQRDHEEGQGKKRRGGTLAERADESESAAAIVRVGDREVEEAHRREVDRLEAEIQRANQELRRANDTIEKMKRAEERKKEDAELAAKALAGEESAPVAEGATEAEKISLLTEQLETLKRAASVEQKRLSSEVMKLDVKAKNALKRATNNHSLYLVVKGQLELAEDKLALLRMKYEGAKKPEEMKSSDLAEQVVETAEAAAAAVEAAAEEAALPASDEASGMDVIPDVEPETAEAAPEDKATTV